MTWILWSVAVLAFVLGWALRARLGPPRAPHTRRVLLVVYVAPDGKEIARRTLEPMAARWN
jgi:hypothetical protein